MRAMRHRHSSLWLRDAPVTESAPPPGRLDTDVAIVGAGITGLTTALLLAEHGVPVVVLERHHVAAVTTGHTTAKVSALHGTAYRQLRSSRGAGAAAAYAAANRAGVRLVRELVDRLGIDCDLVDAPSFTYATDPANRGVIEDEVLAAGTSGLPVEFTSTTGLPFEVAAAVRHADSAHFHPWRYCRGLLEALEDLGVRVFEGAHVLGLEEAGGGVTVGLPDGEVRARRVVQATQLPFDDLGGFFAKAAPSRSYALAATVDGPVPTGMYLSVEEPTRSIRPVRLPEGEGLLLGTGSHKTGTESDTEARYVEMEGWGRATFPVREVVNAWSAQDFTTVDGMPFVGRSPRRRHTYVATGFRKWGMSNGTAAAIMLADALTGADNPWAAAFDATRLTSGSGARRFITVNTEVAAHFVADRVRRTRPPSVESLAPGEAGLVSTASGTAAASRAEDGTVTAVSPTCTHLGCTVRWNAGERSWDCPCHGSRFAATGEVIEGPATRALDQVDPEPPEGS